MFFSKITSLWSNSSNPMASPETETSGFPRKSPSGRQETGCRSLLRRIRSLRTNRK